MNVRWPSHGCGLDVELSVALEAGWRRLVLALSPDQLEDAVLFNLRLWRTLRDLVDARPDLPDGACLSEAADHVATLLVTESRPWPDPRDLAFIAGRNLSLARERASERAAGRARADLMRLWAASSKQAFDDWLLTRLRQHGSTPAPFERSPYPTEGLC